MTGGGEDPTPRSSDPATVRGSDPTTIRGSDPATVRAALEGGDPLPGTAGFAGRIDGWLVRDVLGREPLFVESDRDAGGEGPAWAFDPTVLRDPRPFPAGSRGPLPAESAVSGGSSPPESAGSNGSSPSEWAGSGGSSTSGSAGQPAAGSGTDPRRVWELPDPDPVERAAATGAVREALLSLDVPDCPVAFSGGVDSGLLAALAGDEEGSGPPLYVAGFEDSHDLAAAREAADAMGRDGDLRVVECTHESIREAAVAVARATRRTNAMDVAIAVPLYLVARRASRDGFDRLLVGQGADELFGGYAKVADAPEDPRVEADTVRGARREVLGSIPDQAARDVPALRAAGVDPVVPYLHDRVVGAALALPGDSLVAGDRRKVALRAVASEFLPEVVAERNKKAVQYGSLVDRELDRLARRAGFKRRIGDHVSKWIRSLVAE